MAIECRGLTKQYGSLTALDHLTLSVPAGAIFGFLGPNGAGKTTLVRLLTGLAHPTSGEASVVGLDVRRDTLALRWRMSYLDQHPQFYGWMRGRELLEFVGELYGLQGKELRSRIDEILEQTGLTEAARRKIAGYSGGMRQRLGLAQALINQPEVLFLDEPVSALDPIGRHELLSIIDGLRGRSTVFMSTHILADVERVCDRVAIVDRGRLVVESSVAELQSQYAQPVFLLEPAPGQQDRVDLWQQRLRERSWVADIVQEGALFRVVTTEPETAGRELLPLVTESGVELIRFERSRPSLEEVFLRLVGETQAAGEGLVR